MQINLRAHPAAFDDLEQAFDPAANVAYSSTFLKALFEETGSWQKASGRYHSATPKFNRPYRLKILKLWNEQTRLAYDARRAERKRQAAARRAARVADTPANRTTSVRWTSPPFNVLRARPGAMPAGRRRRPAGAPRHREADGERGGRTAVVRAIDRRIDATERRDT